MIECPVCNLIFYIPFEGLCPDCKSTFSASQRPSWHGYFLGIAKAVSSRADCSRRRVGAVITIDNRIVATGYNGAPSGAEGCLQGACPRGSLSYQDQPKDVGYDNCISVHAEANAIIYARTDLRGAVLYCTDKPCVTCAKLIAGAGIQEIHWIGDGCGSLGE